MSKNLFYAYKSQFTKLYCNIYYKIKKNALHRKLSLTAQRALYKKLSDSRNTKDKPQHTAHAQRADNTHLMAYAP